MWHTNSIFIFLLINLFAIESHATEIWNENFSAPNLGVWGDADGSTIHIDTSSAKNWFIKFDNCLFAAENDYVKTVSTSGGRFEALDCDGEAVWISEWISIRNYSTINCELVAKETGSGKNPASKYLKAFYQLNGNEEVQFETNGINEGNWGESVASQSQLNGDSLRIIVYLNSSYANDKVILDDIRVWSDQAEKIDENQLAKAGDILVNEVLFNPYPHGVDFVELFNNSKKSIRLDHLFLANRNDDHTLKQIVRLLDSPVLFPPHSYLVLSEDQNKILNFYPSDCDDCFIDIENMPAFNNDDGSVVLLADSALVIDEMHYNENMHHPLLIDEEGVSLERISLPESGLNPSNWTSASAESNFATPGFENSMASSENISEDMVELRPKTFSPNDDGYNDVLHINYKFSRADYMANLKIFNSTGQYICDLVKNEPAGSRGEWTWEGLQNDGSKSRIGLYILLLELYSSDGDVKQLKKVCTLADRLE
ncbi:T9SS type B sorting domain-containing protein [Sunxiuqinia indica]|uniref:T9SS type B sorting domain-containing protein n=1 Tax=Sunxiuqinia indica TaxID=2692584 RepID=UPI00135B0ECC|nr:gliding motility-associated C-terminal domain-containing protein [Sunxiuqinia indica]